MIYHERTADELELEDDHIKVEIAQLEALLETWRSAKNPDWSYIRELKARISALEEELV